MILMAITEYWIFHVSEIRINHIPNPDNSSRQVLWVIITSIISLIHLCIQHRYDLVYCLPMIKQTGYWDSSLFEIINWSEVFRHRYVSMSLSMDFSSSSVETREPKICIHSRKNETKFSFASKFRIEFKLYIMIFENRDVRMKDICIS